MSINVFIAFFDCQIMEIGHSMDVKGKTYMTKLFGKDGGVDVGIGVVIRVV